MELDYFDVKLLNSLLQSLDQDGMLGECALWMDGEFCMLCTALERLQALEMRLKDEGKILHTDDSV